jgi:asparagine synthase (glutamine-hydrolysing)
MCGICGIAAQSPLGDADRATVARLTRALAHRGPDDETTYDSPHAAFGFRRLSIIDVAGGAQPIWNEDRSVAVVLNGEIYNFKELRAELTARGHRFRTASDVEVVAHLYEERGIAALTALRGMFALALHDRAHGRLLLARDRVGEKPLYVHTAPGRITFASELGALLAAGVAPLELDPVGVDRYFHFLYAPEPAGLVRGVRQLDAGTYLDVDLTTWVITERRWWSLLDAEPDESDPVVRVREELDTVGRLVIRSDVPVGVALSGGLDSGAVATLAARAHGPGLQAFTVGYEGRPPNDERHDAAVLAAHLKVPLADVALSTGAMVDEFSATVRERDEPIADIAGFGHRAVMRLARAHGVPVLLTGYGGDEVFWGYDWARAAVAATDRRRTAAAQGFPLGAYQPVRRPSSMTAAGLIDWLRDAGGVRSALGERAADRAAPFGRPVFYEGAEEYAAAASRAQVLYAPAMRAALGGHAAADVFGTTTERADLAVMDRLFATYLRSIGLAQGDRLSMAHGVEARVPLVDYRLVEVVVGLQKAHGVAAAPKAWLREAMRGVMPDAVLARPKRGFAPPVWDWHRALMARYGNHLRDGELVARGILSPAGAARLASQAIPERGFATLPFAALVLETWCRAMAGRAS